MNDNSNPRHSLSGMNDDGGREQDGPGNERSEPERQVRGGNGDDEHDDGAAAASPDDEEYDRFQEWEFQCVDSEPEPFRMWFSEPSELLRSPGTVSLGHMLGVRTVRLGGCVEFVLKGCGTCSSSNRRNISNNDTSSSGSRGSQAQSLRGMVEALGRDAACKLIFDQGLRERAAKGNWSLDAVLWLSPRTFVSNRAYCLEWESKGRIKKLWKVAPDREPSRFLDAYYCFCLESTCPDDIPNTLLSLLAGRGGLTVSVLSEEESAISLGALKDLVRTGGSIPHDVTFQDEFPGLSTGQWMEIMGTCHPNTRLCFTSYKGTPCTWSRGLLEAMRQSCTPKRIMVEEFGLLGPLDGAAEAVAGCTSLLELHVQTCKTSGGRGTEAMLGAVAANRCLKVVGVDYVLSSTEWDRLWGVAASHPTLRSVRFNRWNLPAHSRKGDPPGFDRLRSIETAVRSNERLTTVDTIQYDTREEMSEVLSLVRRNRVEALSKEDEGGLGRSWRHRLVSVAVDRSRSKDRTNKYESAAFCYKLLRRNPDVLGRLVDIKDMWRRRWVRHADGLLQAELEMARRGWDVPCSQAHENLLRWKRTYEESMQI